MKKIKVRCSKAVAEEMCRYDDSKIISSILISNQTPTAYLTNEERERFRKYEFIIEGEYHTMDRWDSFGVTPKEVE